MMMNAKFENQNGVIQYIVTDEKKEEIRLNSSTTFLSSIQHFPPSNRPPSSFVHFVSRQKYDNPIGFNWKSIPQNVYPTKIQKEIIENVICRMHGRVLIPLQMGFGKTLLGCLFGLHYGPKALFIVPANKISDWKKEFKQWTGLELSNDLDADYCIVSMSKTKVLSQTSKWRCIIVDESHMLKHKTQRTQQLTPLIHSSPAVILLTGTPFENRSSELFISLNLLYPNVFNNRAQFVERYSFGSYDKFHKWNEVGPKNSQELNAILIQCMVQSNDRQPSTIIRHPIYIVPNKDQIELLEELEKEKNLKKNSATLDPLKTNQLFSHISNMWMQNGSSKCLHFDEYLKPIIEKHSEGNIVLFASHLETVSKAKSWCDEQKLENVVITGETKPKERNYIIEKLSSPQPTRLIGILTIDTCGTGLNLQPGVHVVIFLELDRKPSKMFQAEARADRMGKTHQIYSYWFILKSSSDESIMNKLKRKDFTASEIIEGNKRAKLVFNT